MQQYYNTKQVQKKYAVYFNEKVTKRNNQNNNNNNFVRNGHQLYQNSRNSTKNDLDKLLSNSQLSNFYQMQTQNQKNHNSADSSIIISKTDRNGNKPVNFDQFSQQYCIEQRQKKIQNYNQSMRNRLYSTQINRIKNNYQLYGNDSHSNTNINLNMNVNRYNCYNKESKQSKIYQNNYHNNDNNNHNYNCNNRDNNINVKAIIRLQNAIQKKQQLKKSYTTNLYQIKLNRTANIYSNLHYAKGNKKQCIDMIIPSLHAYNININFNSGPFQDQNVKKKSMKNTKTGNSAFSRRARSQSQNKQALSSKQNNVLQENINITRQLIQKRSKMNQEFPFWKFDQIQGQQQQQRQMQQSIQKQQQNKKNIQFIKIKQKQKQKTQIYWNQRGKPYRQKLTFSSPERKQQIKIRSKNVENIIRRKSIMNFKQDMSQYCRRMNLNQKSKIFVFHSSDIWLKQVLIKKGWILNHDYQSKLYHFKWTYKVCSQNERVHQQQIINHFYDSDLITSKVELAKTINQSILNLQKILKKGGNQNINDYQKYKFLSMYFPKTYDLGHETNEFVQNFKQNQILCGFKKIIMAIEIFNAQNKKQINDQIQAAFFNKYQLRSAFKQLKEKENYLHQQESEQMINNTNFVIHIPYAIQLCAFCQNIQCKLEKQQKQQENKLNEKTLKNLLNFSNLNPPYNQYISSSSTQTSFSSGPSSLPNKKVEKIHFHKTNLNMYSSAISFQRPSKRLIKLLLSYHKYLSENYSTYKADGYKNIWIIKNRNSSKGSGIMLSNSLQQILKKTQNKLVQKYIQSCALYRTIENKSEQISQTKASYKFDLRVWVLVTSFKPLISYFYQKFYCRLCSQQYSLQNLNQLQSHITNYTKNKQSFATSDGKKSILTYQQFIQTIKKYNKDLPPQKMKQKISNNLHKLIYYTLSLYENKIQSNAQCFQLYGFDILVSDQLDLYLLEINLSPACQDRDEWLSQNVRNMSQGLINIVVENQRPNKQQGYQNWSPIRPF